MTFPRQQHHLPVRPLPPQQKSKQSREGYTNLKRHFITILAGTHPSFPPTFGTNAYRKLNLRSTCFARPRIKLQSPSIVTALFHRRPFGFPSHPLIGALRDPRRDPQLYSRPGITSGWGADSISGILSTTIDPTAASF
jgi:hypothetical protein